MNALQGARAVGAKYVVAVDPVAFKREWAAFFGATHAAASAEEAAPLVRELTRGVMADRVVLTPGVVPTDLLLPAMMLTRKGGTCVLTGLGRYDELPVPLVLNDMVLAAKQLKGLLGGGMNPRVSTPMLLSMYREGRLKLDELITRRYRLEQINGHSTICGKAGISAG
jgi:Zn-dependent alcohol dehydrogenase